MTIPEQPLVVPVGAPDQFGTTGKYRSCRVLVTDGATHRKLCWASFAPDGSISAGLSDPGLVIAEVGRARTDDHGRVVERTPAGDLVPNVAPRTAPHVTLHRSGLCHVRAHGQPELVRTRYDNWHPPTEPFEWFQAVSSRASTLPSVSPGSRDVVVTVASLDTSLVARFDILPRPHAGALPFLRDAIYTAVGVGPDFMLRISLVLHAPTAPQFLLRPSHR